MKCCTKCRQEKDIVEFNFKSREKNLHHGQCKDCTRASIRKHYVQHREYYLKKTKVQNHDYRTLVSKFVLDYLHGHPCVDCGEKDVAVLEFDHNGLLPKIKAVSSLVRARHSIEVIKLEIAKCDVRCANCHRRKTARDFKWYKKKMPL